MSSQDNSVKRKRQRSTIRDPNPERIRITDRDMEILCWLNKVRMLTIDQIQSVFFASEDEPRSGWRSARHRMRKLFDHKLVAKIQKPFSSVGDNSYVYSLDELGALTVQRYLEDSDSKLIWQPHHNNIKGLHIPHYEATNNLWVVLHKLNQREKIRLHTWYSDMQFKSEPLKNHLPFNSLYTSKKRKFVEPDGFYAYSLPNMTAPHAFFVEVDTGEEALPVVENKFKVYHAYRLSEESKDFYGVTKWRLLIITSSAGRLKNIMKKAAKVGCEHYCWFTTLDNLDIWNPSKYFQNIWMVVGRDGFYSL